jgi:DNA topoisomerase-1
MQFISNREVVRYKTLVIVESPSKCRTIEKYLGPSYLCVASCGHLREIANGLAGTGVGPDKVDEPSYAIIPKKMHYVRQIKTAIAECNGTVILGTDADREGEAIAWHICQLFQLPVDTTPRIVFREITSEALEHAIRNPRVIDMALVRSQQTRQILDLLIGYKTTPLLWSSGIANKKYNKGTKHQNKILSSGRSR